ncbi:MAG TPA: peptidase domain-containing ABC transporter [Ferruginibacter sp.]|jgi:ATP-binding cassette subfamily B protein|nr:peptidase domain-containing ABC transporter [Ferruginibacter sp.]
MSFKRFPHYRQYDEMDCGPTCLRIICEFYGKKFSLEYLRQLTNTTRLGSSLLGISEAAEKIGLRTIGAKLSYEDLLTEVPMPCIAYWYQRHFIVIYKITKDKVYVSDPAHGIIKYTKAEFLKGWAVDNEEGVILSIEPTPDFNEIAADQKKEAGGLSFIYQYLLQYKQLLIQLVLGLIVASLIQLIFPFVTQAIVDTGIRYNNLSFIYLMLLAQLLLFLGKTSVEVLRGYILMHLSTRININLLSDFFIKLMKLPLGFFDVKMTGDILQRIQDHQRVETFLTSGTVNVAFSFINILVFSVVLFIYNPLIFIVFAVGSILYFVWVFLFMKQNALLDYKRFDQLSQNQEKNLELIYGMQEIKLHNASTKKRWQWEDLQAKLFKINLKSLRIKQMQTSGASLINELKNIIVSFLAAKLVIQGQISLGVMLSVSYIIGQLNAPILQLVEFTELWQNARLSIARINEIHNKPDEENIHDKKITEIIDGDISLKDVSFSYTGNVGLKPTIDNINLVIPHKKVTAIVGSSGSGKTTLMKLLLKFYEPSTGEISIADDSISDIAHTMWRKKCGAVMQDGYIFNDTVAYNIGIGEEIINKEALLNASKIANIHEFISELPLGYNTKIGQNGMGLSAGQKQRILIARAVYKNPDILLFDEATSALDAKNERIIIENLNKFFKGKTVIVIAHRLSTVKDADKIIVMEHGEIIEEGSHEDLVLLRNSYFNLVKNQLELGS